MNLDFTNAERSFRTDVREWIASNLERFGHDKKSFRDRQDLEYRREWEAHLCREGWACLSWPKEYGGRSLAPINQLIFWEEYAAADAPVPFNPMGHGILGPTLIVHGTEEQKLRFLPPLLRNEEFWCQGYSEPNAGSDLASLTTRAERSGDHYVLNGRKIWTSFAFMADWCFLLARTDRNASPHKGISFLLVDMHSPGISIDRIRQMTDDAEFCEVVFENVKVPLEMRVGEENAGWPIAMAAVSFERGTYFIPWQVRLQTELSELMKISAARRWGNGTALTDSHIGHRLVDLFIDSTIMRLQSYRIVSEVSGGGPPGPQASFTKLFWSETHQKILELGMELVGQPDDSCSGSLDRLQNLQWTHNYLKSRAETIYAGTSEIQRNIIAERVLGLPKS